MSNALTRLGVAPEGLLRRRVSPGRAERIGLMAILVLATAIPIPVLAQGVVVQGRVFQFGSTSGIANATVDLEGHGSTLTSAAGTFRFEDVDPGEYTLRVEALGYDPESRVLTVDSTTRPVLVPLRIAPLTVDSLTVQLRTIDIKGRVRDPEHDMLVVNAEVLTNQVAGTYTDAHGRFTLEDVLEGVPVRVVVRPFGYLRVDTTFVPDEDEDYLFEVEPDPWVEEMIAVQIAKIVERGTGVYDIGTPPITRERLLRYTGTFTLRDMLEAEYPGSTGRVICAFVDEVKVLDPSDSAIPGVDGRLGYRMMLDTTLPEELERIELMSWEPTARPPLLLRIYTREFMQKMFDLELELRTPVLTVSVATRGSPLPGAPPRSSGPASVCDPNRTVRRPRVAVLVRGR